jgi:hypothetical protein
LAQQALRAAWGWEFGEPVSSRELYEYIHPLLAFESGLATNRKQLDALLSVVSAIYYVTWKADGLERRARVASRDKNLPNDVAEVDEDTVAQSLDYAARSAGDESEARWQQEAINKLHADFAVEDMNELGERVSPEYFRGIDRS